MSRAVRTLHVLIKKACNCRLLYFRINGRASQNRAFLEGDFPYAHGTADFISYGDEVTAETAEIVHGLWSEITGCRVEGGVFTIPGLR